MQIGSQPVQVAQQQQQKQQQNKQIHAWQWQIAKSPQTANSSVISIVGTEEDANNSSWNGLYRKMQCNDHGLRRIQQHKH